jgi:hypothetical protein
MESNKRSLMIDPGNGSAFLSQKVIVSGKKYSDMDKIIYVKQYLI